jgi:hypothetical protein
MCILPILLRQLIHGFCFCILSALLAPLVLFGNIFLFCREHSCTSEQDNRFDKGDEEPGKEYRSLPDTRVAQVPSSIPRHKQLLWKHDTECEFL